MSKELEALERLYCAGRLDLDYVINGRQKEDYYIIETTLKALEIIKEKRVDAAVLIGSESLYDYNDYMNSSDIYEYENSRQLTQEEYDLLKEVLL